MKKLNKFYILLAFEFVLILLASRMWVDTFLTILIGVWGILTLICIKIGNVDSLSKKEQLIWKLIIVLYRIFETFMKFMIVNEIIPGSWNVINRIEHFIFSVILPLALLPIIKQTIKKLHFFELIIFIVGIVLVFGTLNELWEYFLRVRMGLTSASYFSVYYWDTIFDMGVNLVGGIVSICLLYYIKEHIIL